MSFASWEDLLEDLREEEVTSKALTVDRLWPLLLFMQEPNVTSSLVDLHDSFWRSPDRSEALPSHPIRLTVSEDLINVLLVKRSIARQTVDEFEPLVALARRIIEELREELAAI